MRAWATVVTVMAVACFVFVQPMPENVNPFASARATNSQSISIDQMAPTGGFVDSAMTGKTFTPFLTVAPPQVIADRLSHPYDPRPDLGVVVSVAIEPPTRPG